MYPLLVASLLAITIIPAEDKQFIPLKEGMTWKYDLVQETGEGVKISDSKVDAEGKIRASVIYRFQGPVKLNGKDLLKFEMHRDGVVTNTDLLSVDARGISCAARITIDGETVFLNPAQVMVAAPLVAGGAWDFDGKIGDTDVHQHYAVIDQQDVTVPAGKFHAFHIHGEQTLPNSVIIDRWFVNGTGIVKDVTSMRTRDGDLVQRISIELKEIPKVAPRPEVRPIEAPKKISATLGRDPVGETVTNFATDTPKIYARWQGRDLHPQAKIRAVWIAENIADAVHDYTIDEATATATAADSHGIFTLAQPDDGWAPGEYRVEFYVDDALTETVKLTIGK